MIYPKKQAEAPRARSRSHRKSTPGEQEDPVIRTYTRLQKQLQNKQRKFQTGKKSKNDNHPKARVIQYESPNMRRLRETETEILKTYETKPYTPGKSFKKSNFQ